MFLQKSVDAREACAHEVVTSACAFAKPGGCEYEQGNRQEADDREPRVHPQHDGDDRENRDDIAEEIRYAFSKQLIERVDVRGQSCHHTSNWIAIVVGDFLTLQLVIQLLADVEHHVLPD